MVDPGLGTDVHREKTTIDLYGEVTPGSAEHVPRARFDVDLVSLHPCKDTDCTVGDPAAPTTIGAVLGADALRGDAIRFDFPNSDVYVLPSIGGDDEARSRQCDAVFSAPYRGGGTLVLGGAEVGFDGRRVALGVCLGSTPDGNGDPTGGTDALFVLSTGIGPSIIDTTAYQRYCLAPHLPRAGRSCRRPPCSCRRARSPAAWPRSTTWPWSGCRRATRGARARTSTPATSWSRTTAASPAARAPAARCAGRRPRSSSVPPLDVVVVPDDEPVIQALRAELRPDQAEVDGILGTDALAALQLDLDYPDGRALARCGAGVDPRICKVRPALFSGSYKARVLACVGQQIAIERPPSHGRSARIAVIPSAQ